ncbi:RagB/SusD family nutrient uptake outer membrane protein [Mucilaginibacter aquaedulcis]|uniref:RagB/SusD family nutrient uptake outer membrane protein n=1 Tax=Mucilaginibacter aquaedulcis TaxID=1187081 RepID=UPI0025B5D1ED|nr:RagB/SusD family nutrient uptake outer membrane protein [Mucilaginibacter aquaedulcis]MDN3548915.1 RagB/SusD family nutrient uptake outer membrane protein [Mucilaginibacter aquaedulcis]
MTGLVLFFAGCKRELDIKPSSSLQVPSSVADFQAMMDNTGKFNVLGPFAGTLAADDGFVTDATWNAAHLTARNAYIWDRNLFNDNVLNDWSYAYAGIFTANVVLEGITKYGTNGADWASIKGQAMFFRGYDYLQLAQEFCKAYDEQTAGSDAGLVLRASSDLNIKSVRSTVSQTYQQIISDLNTAVNLLPVNVITKTRPGKAAAYAALSRTYLAMRAYDKAGLYADSCLQLGASLLDYNQVAGIAAISFQRFNNEVIIHTTMTPDAILTGTRYLVDTSFYASYAPEDLRRILFFVPLRGSTYLNFRGSYDGTTSRLFYGPTTAEMYLVRAECNVRAGRINQALDDLNALRQKRYKTVSYQPLASADAGVVLGWVLTERRKEMVFRGQRWSDLRRLNKEPSLAKTLVKIVNGKRYELPPGDPRYVLPIPQAVINDTGIPQN